MEGGKKNYPGRIFFVKRKYSQKGKEGFFEMKGLGGN